MALFWSSTDKYYFIIQHP